LLQRHLVAKMAHSTICEDLAPLFQIDYFMCVLPFSKFDSRNCLKPTFAYRCVTFFVQMALLFEYVYFYLQALSEFTEQLSEGFRETSETISYLTFLILGIVDGINIIIIIFFSVKASAVINVFLKLVHKADSKFQPKSDRNLVIKQLALFVAYYIIKLLFFIIKVDKGRIFLRLSSRLLSGIIMASELTLTIFCLQLRRRMFILNNLLMELSSDLKVTKLDELKNYFDMITKAQKSLRDKLGPYLLFNLTQLFFMTLCALLFVILSCGANFENVVAPMEGECTGRFFMFLESAIRFIMIVWACSSFTCVVSEG